MKKTQCVYKTICKIILTIHVLLLVVLPAVSSSAFAQVGSGTASAISITPPLSEIKIKPGKSIIQAFNIKNEGGYDLEVTPTIVEFVPNEQTGEASVLLESDPFPYAKLQNLDKQLNQPFVLRAGQDDQLVIKIEIPNTQQPRDYYQTLLLQTKPVGVSLQNTSQAFPQAYIGVHLLISVTYDDTTTVPISIQTIKTPVFLDIFSKLPIQIIARNEGARYTKVKGSVRITSIGKREVAVFPILQENVLAQSVRELHASQKNPDEEKTLQAIPFLYNPTFLLGPYTISVEILNEQDQVVATAEKTVFAFPFSICIVFFGMMGMVFFSKKLQYWSESKNHSDTTTQNGA